MILTCPHCLETYTLDQVTNSAQLLEYGELLGRFGERNRALVLGFLGCFRRPGGTLSLSRRVRLLAAVWAVIERGELTYDRRTWRVDYALVLAALAETTRTKELAGLANLNYTWKILTAKTKEVDAQAERAREAERQAGAHRGPARKGDGPRPLAEALPQPAPPPAPSAPVPTADDPDRLPPARRPLPVGKPTSGDNCLPEGAHPSRLDYKHCEDCAKLFPAEAGAGWRCRDIAREHQKSPTDRACSPNYEFRCRRAQGEDVDCARMICRYSMACPQTKEED